MPGTSWSVGWPVAGSRRGAIVRARSPRSTAPSFGPCTAFARRPCRARRDRPVCCSRPAVWCPVRHAGPSSARGRRSVPTATTTRARRLAVARPGAVASLHDRVQRDWLVCAALRPGFRVRCKLAYSKVSSSRPGAGPRPVPLRLDGPKDQTAPPPTLRSRPLTSTRRCTRRRSQGGPGRPPLADGTVYRLRWAARSTPADHRIVPTGRPSRGASRLIRSGSRPTSRST